MKDWIEMKDWSMKLCPEIAEWQAEMIAVQVQIRIRYEREQCAQVCESSIIDQYINLWNDACQSCADDIRARGEA